MKKLLHTFFFGYADFKYRRLIRTPIILSAVGVFIAPIVDDHDLFIPAVLVVIGGFVIIGFISYLIEPFIVKKNKEVIAEIPLDEPIIKQNVSQGKSTQILSSQIKTTDRPSIEGNLKKIYSTLIILIKKFNNNKILSNIFYYSLFFISSLLIISGLGNFFSPNLFDQLFGLVSFSIGTIIIIILWKYEKVF
tara:strand:- start:1883 stop:2458 length:576 start_codon:yes stop_codon:yes gene_type:complete